MWISIAFWILVLLGLALAIAALVITATQSKILQIQRNIFVTGPSSSDPVIDSNLLKDVIMSSFYETEPVGYLEQPWFINSVASAKTDLDPNSLFEICRKTENQFGRILREQWHERELDIDILLYGNEQIWTNKLEIPHPRMNQRRFVLVPAAEIAGDWINPNTGLTIKQMLAICPDESDVRLYSDN